MRTERTYAIEIARVDASETRAVMGQECQRGLCVKVRREELIR